MILRAFFVSLFVALTALSAPPAAADQTVTFNVPVHISHFFSKTKKIRVACIISSSQFFKKPFAVNSVTIQYRGGGYDGVVHVPVTVRELYVPKAKYWECGMQLYGDDGSTCYIGVNAPSPECKLKPGAPLKVQVTGKLKLQPLSRRSPSQSHTQFVPKAPAPLSR